MTKDPSLAFGSFRLVPARRLLLKGGEAIAIGSRAFDILLLLLRHAGEVVSKKDIMTTVWPDQVVVEGNLTVQIANLRRLLRDEGNDTDPIQSVPGRGYLLSLASSAPPAPKEASLRHRGDLAERPAPLIGRAAELSGLEARLPNQRLVTIVGSAGVGKTAIATQLAHNVSSLLDKKVCFVSLAPIIEEGFVASALAMSLACETRSGDIMERVIERLVEQPTLLVLDNCEHLIEEVAGIVVMLIENVPELSILATSREPLAISAERIYRLGPLEVPPESEAGTVEAAIAYSAIQLFVDRASAQLNDFALDAENVGLVSTICRKLDGIPLAIKFAASRLNAFGVKALATSLDDATDLLDATRRTEDPRHRTLAATLEWSYRLLTADEQHVLRTLSVFAGSFSLGAAQAVAMRNLAGPSVLVGLVEKSLVLAEPTADVPRFRLLETTRAYAAGKLTAAGERREAQLRHATHFRDALRQAEYELRPTRFALDIDNIRKGIAWALAPGGDEIIAAELALLAVPVWFGLSLLTECRHWLERVAKQIPPAMLGTHQEMDIQLSLASATFFTAGLTPDARTNWTRAYMLAQQLGDQDRELDALVALWTYEIRLPAYEEALTKARLHQAIAQRMASVDAVCTSHWMLGTTRNHAGDLAEARRDLDLFLKTETPAAREAFLKRTGFDRRSDALGLLALTRAIMGDIADADSIRLSALAEARSIGSALPICEALLWSCLIHHLVGGQADAAREEADLLMDLSRRHHLDSHRAMGCCFQGLLLAEAGSHADAMERMREGIDGLATASYGPFVPLIRAALAQTAVSAGRLEQAQAALADPEGVRTINISWCTVEFLRAEGCLSAAQGDVERAVRLLGQAISLADRQQARLLAAKARSDRERLVPDAGRALRLRLISPDASSQ